jgi:Fe-S oxidoreductase
MRLPLLEERRPELETCALCPKLSRAACPVSNADAHETTTPWGKMSAAWYLARGAVEATAAQAWPPWACTGCFACREACELRNDVAGTLLDARADLVDAGLAPAAATRAIERHEARAREAAAACDALVDGARARGVDVVVGAPDRILVGCLDARARAGEAVDALVAGARLLGGPVDLVRGCCGAPLRAAGDRRGFAAAARKLAGDLEGARALVVADAGCAHALRKRAPEVALPMPVEVLHLAELAFRALPRLPRLHSDAAPTGDVRYHDACALGRGLGVYEPPRAVLTALLGRAPEEFARRRDGAVCSGAGGLLPTTFPETARAIAAARIAEHDELGGGPIVTTCASSRRALSRAGRSAAGRGAEVFDLATLLARALER